VKAAIITARTGSESIPQKNIMDIAGRPMLEYPIQAAKESDLIDETFVSTDGPEIANIAENAGARVLNRPEELKGDSSHGDVIKHSIEEVDRIFDGILDMAVILLGNSVMIDGELIDLTIEAVESSEADSAMTVWRAEDDHPQRAMKRNPDGYLSYHKDEYNAENSNRQNYDDIYYYDNGPWTLEPHCVKDRSGPGPWWWMGEKCLPVEREWVTGRDIHDYFDVALQKYYVENRTKLIKLEDRNVLRD